VTAHRFHHTVLVVIGVACGLVSAWLALATTRRPLVAEWLQRLELVAYDYRAAASATLPRSDQIVIVTIDEESLNVLPQWPWPRSFHAKVIRSLKKAGAKLVGVDIILAGVSNPNAGPPAANLFAEPEPSEDDKELAAAIKEAGNVFLAAEISSQEVAGYEGQAEQEFGNYPHPDFEDAAAGVGIVNVLKDPLDDVVRAAWAMYRFQDQLLPTLPMQLAAHMMGMRPQELSAKVLREARGWLPSNLTKQGQTFLIGYRAPVALGFRRIPYYKVLDGELQPGGEIGPEAVKGKIVLIGPTAQVLQDLHPTPVKMLGTGGRGAQVALMPGVEIHANTVDTILSSRFIVPATPTTTYILSVLFGLAMALALQLRPLRGLAVGWLPLCLMGLLGPFPLFKHWRLWVPIVPLLTATTLTYTFGTVYLELTAERTARRLRQAWSKRVSPEVLDVILRNPTLTQVRGRNVVATVWFSDLQGFTTYCSSAPPERVVDQLNRHLSLATDIIRKHGGTLHKFIGDGIMAVFGDPVPHPDSAARAVRAAWELQQEMAALRANLGEDDWKMIVRIGIHTGELVAGDIGSEDLLEYTVIGDTVSTASRMEGLNKDFGTNILISASTRERLGDEFQVEPLGMAQVRGRAEPIEVYTIKGVSGNVGQQMPPGGGGDGGDPGADGPAAPREGADGQDHGNRPGGQPPGGGDGPVDAQ
jgi:adenylate cyclase